MNYPTAIVVAAALIAGAVVFGNIIPAVQAQRTGPWQVVAPPEGKGTVAWRFNTTTGELEWCLATRKPLTCMKMPPP